MTKKRIIIIGFILTAAIIVCFAVLFFYKQKQQKMQTAIQNFGIIETDDISISDYDKFGLWNDQILQLSTQKGFDRFADENIIGSITITTESDSQVGEISIHSVSFEYINGNRKIYGTFTMRSNSDINFVSLKIYG
ncbi:MAG: hypothetical protein IJM34_04875 [Lachnospiraceae bacterium]|nr:hypothetical protein [Lachnospiraceae bacterium]